MALSMRFYDKCFRHVKEEIIGTENKNFRRKSALDVCERTMVRDFKAHYKTVAEAVLILLNSADDIKIFHKKAIYLYLREITGLKTKQIVGCLTHMKRMYEYEIENYL